jgi:hypothetical protein
MNYPLKADIEREVYIGQRICGLILRFIRYESGCKLQNGDPVGFGHGVADKFVRLLPYVFGRDGKRSAIASAISKWENAGSHDVNGGTLLKVNERYLMAICQFVESKSIGDPRGRWTYGELGRILLGDYPWDGLQENYSGIQPLGKVIDSLLPIELEDFTSRCRAHLATVKILGDKNKNRVLNSDERTLAIASLRQGIFMHGLQDVTVSLFSHTVSQKLKGDADAWMRLKASAYWQLRTDAVNRIPDENAIKMAELNIQQSGERFKTPRAVTKNVQAMTARQAVPLLIGLLQEKLAELEEDISVYDAYPITEEELPVVCLPGDAKSKICALFAAERKARGMVDAEFIRYTGLTQAAYDLLLDGKVPTDEQGAPIDFDILVSMLQIAVPLDRTVEPPIALTVAYYSELLDPFRACVNH